MRGEVCDPTGWDWAALRAASAREARRIVRSPHDADEIAQEALLRAWRRSDSCRAPENPLPWVLKITRMETYRHLERGATRSQREGAVLSDQQFDPEPPDGDALLRRISGADALALLTSDERALVAARYVDDLTQPAAAELLGMPEGTAKVRLHRIRVRLRAVLEESV
jgi:RNA polymerase sigma-70 factor (ECF subfamily)